MMMHNRKIKFATFEASLEVICEAGYTPHIIANVNHPDYRGMMEPCDENGMIVLNISGDAVMSYFASEEGISFLYTEGGAKRGQGFVPMDALGSVYAKEDINMMQPFPYKKVIDSAKEAVKVVEQKSPVQKTPTRPVRKAFTPTLIKGGKK